VIATLQPVADDSSKDLMVNFYQSLFGDADGDPVTAMHRAKIAQLGTGLAGGIADSTAASFRVFVPSVEDFLR
jgi:hypothetical protein